MAAMQYGVTTESLAASQGEAYGVGVDSTGMPPAPTGAMVSDASTHKLFGYTQFNPAGMSDTQLHNAIDSALLKGKPVIVNIGSVPTWMYQVYHRDASGNIFSEPYKASTTLSPDAAFKALADLQHSGEADSGVSSINNGAFTTDGHCFAIVGLDDSLYSGAGGYIVENSWGLTNDQGTPQGYNGYYVIPKDFRSEGMPLTGLVVTLDGFSGVDQTWTTNRGTVASIYQSVLNRAADYDGLLYWGSAMDKGATIRDVFNSMYNSSEGQAVYAGLSDSGFINKAYLDIRGRAPTSSEASTELYLLQHSSRADELYSIMLNEINYASQVTATEHDRFVNRTQVSESFALTYKGTGHLDVATAALNGGTAGGVSFTAVTADANTLPATLIGIHNALGYT
jgi:hypothetical protein